MNHNDFQTKSERRQAKRERQNAHPVHGRGLEAIMNSMRNRANKLEGKVK